MLKSLLSSSPIIILLILFLTYIVLVVYMKNVFQKNPKGLESIFAVCQIMLITIGMIVVCKAIVLFAGQPQFVYVKQLPRFT